MKALKILVSGCQGQLGSEIQNIEKDYPEYQFTFTNRSSFNLANEEDIKSNLSGSDYDFFINTAAYTAVDKAETEQALSYEINGMALFHIMQYLPESCTLIHISSDYVYHHNPKRPLKEDDPCLPQGVYAKSKKQGEEFILASSKKAVIIRTSWVYSTFGNNFVKTMKRLGASKDSLSIVSDQIGAPTYAKDIAACIMKIINSDQVINKGQNQIYNFCNDGQTNWAAFAKQIFELEGLDCQITPVTTEDYNAPAPRPKWSVLDMSKIMGTYQIKLRPWQESLSECLSKLQ